MTIDQEFAKTAVDRMRRNLRQISTAVGFLEDEEIWRDFGPHLVSVGNLVSHLAGNIRQHILSGLGGEPYTRHRDLEFTEKPGLDKARLLAAFSDVVEKATRVIERLRAEDLTKTYTIQGFEYSGLGDVIAVATHMSYHTGQIAFAVKSLKNVDLGFGEGIDLNRQNAPGGGA